MENTNKKTEENPVNERETRHPARREKTDVESAGLSGQVKQVMQTRYKAHLRAETIVQGKIQNTHGDNFLTAYNEDGSKIQETTFSPPFYEIKTFNAQKQHTESVQYYNGALWKKTFYTYNGQGQLLETIYRNPDGSIDSQHTSKYNEQGKPLESVFYNAVKKQIYSREVYEYNEQGKELSHIAYDKDGTIERQYLHKYNGQGNQIESITELKDKNSEYNSRTTHQYNGHGDTTETIYYRADGSIKSKYTYDYKYNPLGQRIETTHHLADGRVDAIHSFKYNPQGKLIETVYSDADGSLRGSLTYKYNPQGQCTEQTHYNSDKSIERIHILVYDSAGKHTDTSILNSDGSKHDFARPKAEGETEEYEYDAHKNWIKKTTFHNKLPIHIYLRELIYFTDQTQKELTHPLLNAVKEDTENTADLPKELSAEDAKWLAEIQDSATDFSALRYYVLVNNESPSTLIYSGPYIEALALLRELEESMNAQVINSYSTIWHRQGERLHHYTLRFPRKNGYLLSATAISEKDEEEYNVPEFITEHHRYRSEGMVHFGQIEFLRPSEASGKRDDYFEEQIHEYISKCSLRKKPDKPVIQMIEVKGTVFAMVEHAVDDDFEIKDLDINYGYGFKKFHAELMQRFNTDTKGLVLFHGEPGTGKTFYIRHLLRKMLSGNKKVVVYMPPNMVDHLVEPAFMTFLSNQIKHWASDGFFTVLLIEDAEPLLAKRQEGVRIQGVTNLLNMTDGLLNDMLNLQIICTFNVDLKRLDSALLRPGRLIARKEFKPLSEIDANLLAQRLGIKHHFKKPATLGEVYAMLKNKNTLIHDVEPDKGASKNIDDL